MSGKSIDIVDGVNVVTDTPANNGVVVGVVGKVIKGGSGTKGTTIVGLVKRALVATGITEFKADSGERKITAEVTRVENKVVVAGIVVEVIGIIGELELGDPSIADIRAGTKGFQ